jgi:hypothetical protein
VHSGASGPQNIDALFFMLGWAWRGFYKKRAGTCYVELVFFSSDGIYGSHCAFWCDRSVKC